MNGLDNGNLEVLNLSNAPIIISLAFRLQLNNIVAFRSLNCLYVNENKEGQPQFNKYG